MTIFVVLIEFYFSQCVEIYSTYMLPFPIHPIIKYIEIFNEMFLLLFSVFLIFLVCSKIVTLN